MTYKITIERLEDTGEKYPNKTEIFTQQVDDLDVVAVIRAVNKIGDQHAV
jgi:hypothetical protein